MRKTRLVILPTRCLHQMGFLLLFLSCPVIGDWGRIRPESENLHKAIQIDREGTCGLQRDPPGKLLHFQHENGFDQCRLSEDFDSNGITKKPISGEVRRYYERRIVSQRVARERNVQESERRELNDERKEARKAMRRVADERRNIRKEPQRDIRRNIREISQIRTRSIELRQSSRDGQQENERATRRQVSVSARRISKNNEIDSRNERERLHQIRRMTERQNERRIEQQRHSIREITNERRENERAIRTAPEMRERETQRLVRSERERLGLRRDNNRRSVHERSVRKRDSDVAVRQIRERSLDRQNERLSLARKEQNKSRRSESGRDAENPERRLSQIGKTPNTETDGEVIEQRTARNFDNRRDIEKRKLSGGDIRERRTAPLNGRRDRIMDIKSTRVNGVTKHQYLSGDASLENKNADEKVSGGIPNWMNFKRFKSLKVGDWTTNCVIGAVVYYFSTRQIKAV